MLGYILGAPKTGDLPYTMYYIPYTMYSTFYTIYHNSALGFLNSHMGGCQNYGSLLGSLNTRCRNILRNQNGTIVFTTTRMDFPRPNFRARPWGSRRRNRGWFRAKGRVKCGVSTRKEAVELHVLYVYVNTSYCIRDRIDGIVLYHTLLYNVILHYISLYHTLVYYILKYYLLSMCAYIYI